MENSILKIAKKLISKGPLHVGELYSLSISQLKRPENEISQAIFQLFSKKILIKESKITKDTIFNNDTRRKIFAYISDNPGSHTREIREKLDLTPHQTAWHLKMLEKFGYIRKISIKNKIIYFDSEINPDYEISLFILKDGRNLRILEAILLEPGINISTLAKNVKVRTQVVKGNTDILQKLDLIRELLDENNIKYIGKIKNIEPILRILKVPEEKIKKYEESAIGFQKKLEIKQ